MSKPAQLVVTFTGGYIAGVFCALISHPADTVVSKLNSDVGSTAIQAAKDLGMKGEGGRRGIDGGREREWGEGVYRKKDR